MPLPVVAVLGATGHLGSYIANALLSPQFRHKFSSISILHNLARAPSEKVDHLREKGASIKLYLEGAAPPGTIHCPNLKKVLSNVDILINTIGSSGYKFRDRVLEAIASTKRVKLYFPSEFGVNHTTHTFSQPEWDHKQHHMELASNLLKDVRICQVYNGLFLEDSIGPWFGFDTKNGIYEIAGSRDARVTFTSLEDVGKAVATLASTWKDLDKIPRTVQLAGDTLTINDIAELMKKEGAGEVEVKEIDGPAYEKKILALTNTLSPEKHLRFLLGKGAIDYSNETGTKNDNEVVNSGERDWKWKTMADYARETNGKPWADSEWKEDV